MEEFRNINYSTPKEAKIVLENYKVELTQLQSSVNDITAKNELNSLMLQVETFINQKVEDFNKNQLDQLLSNIDKFIEEIKVELQKELGDLRFSVQKSNQIDLTTKEGIKKVSDVGRESSSNSVKGMISELHAKLSNVPLIGKILKNAGLS